MFFSPTCQYAIRALINLASSKSEGPVLARTIAEEEGIPQQFLSKILHILSKRGVVVSTKGPGGGYQLASPARDISVFEIVKAIDGPIDIEDVCILGLDQCSDAQSCPMHSRWKQFRSFYMEMTHTVMLDQMVTTLSAKRSSKGSKKEK